MSIRTSRRIASPRARRALRRNRIDIAQILGSGPQGRIVEADVLQWAQTAIGTAENREAVVATANPEKERALFQLRAELDASVLLGLQTRHQFSTHEFLERALTRIMSGYAEDSLDCRIAENTSARADEFCPALPLDADGVLAAGRIVSRPFVVGESPVVCPTLRLHLCGDAAKQSALGIIFDGLAEIIENPMLLVFG